MSIAGWSCRVPPFPPSPFRSTVITGQPACMANARVTSCCFFGPDGLIYRYGMKITGSREDGERRGEGKREGRKNGRKAIDRRIDEVCKYRDDEFNTIYILPSLQV